MQALVRHGINDATGGKARTYVAYTQHIERGLCAGLGQAGSLACGEVGEEAATGGALGAKEGLGCHRSSP